MVVLGKSSGIGRIDIQCAIKFSKIAIPKVRYSAKPSSVESGTSAKTTFWNPLQNVITVSGASEKYSYFTVANLFHQST